MSDNKNFQSGKKIVNPIAFPTNGGANGMTLRDYFAAKAMASLLQMVPANTSTIRIAEDAWKMADCMLRFRNAKFED